MANKLVIYKYVTQITNMMYTRLIDKRLQIKNEFHI